jgi:hypothetical protein
MDLGNVKRGGGILITINSKHLKFPFFFLFKDYFYLPNSLAAARDTGTFGEVTFIIGA